MKAFKLTDTMNAANRFVLVLGASLLVCAVATAQVNNPQYSLYHYTPLLTNPALSSMRPEASVLLGYKDQRIGGASGVNTPTLQAMYPFIRKGKEDSLHFGTAGLLVMQDRYGPNGMVTTTGGAISYAHNLHVGNGHKFNLGLQLGFFQRALDDSKLQTGAQYDFFNGRYNSGLGTGETFNNTTVSYLPINGGLGYFRTDDYGDVRYYVTVGAANLNQPKTSFLADGEGALPVRGNLVAGARVYNTDQFAIVPTVRGLYANGEDNQYNIGSLFQFKTHGDGAVIGEGSIGVGAWYSLNNSAVFSLEINQPGFTVAFGYDYITSGLSDFNSQARSYELVLGVKKWLGGKRKKKVSYVAPPAEEPVVEEKPKPVAPVQPAAPVAPAQPSEPVQEVKPEPVAPKPVVPQAPEPEQEEEEEVLQQEPVKPAKPAVKKAVPAKPGKKTALDLTEDEAAKYGLTAAELRLMRRTKPKFDFNSIELSEGDKNKLDKIYNILKAKPDVRIEISGHTDNVGGLDINQTVSELRANVGKTYLVEKGIDPDRISTVGKAFSEPVQSNATPNGRKLNRRIEIRPLN